MTRTLILLLFTAAAAADARLPAIFGKGMVLQADRPIEVHGWADPGEEVTVRLDGAGEPRHATTKADDAGRWRVSLPKASYAAGLTLVVEAANRITLDGVCVGEVWLCSGQSNMAFPLRSTSDAETTIAEADDPRLRLFTVAFRVAAEPADDVQGRWEPCTAESAARFSAVAYHFGRALRERLGVPVGLIHSSVGGTPAEAWTSGPALAAVPALAPILERWDRAFEAWPRARDAWAARVREWERTKEGRRPPPPLGPQHPHRPAGLYNAMIAPLRGLGLAGVIWYQGESNAGRAVQYGTLFPTLIRDWRAKFCADLPFYYVQLANFQAERPEPGPSPWAELREAQRLTLAEPHCGMAVTIDIGDARDIHPRNKRDVGGRLAAWALRRTYGLDDVVCSGPLFRTASVQGRTMRIAFDFAEGLATRDGGAPTGFQVAGADRRWRWAHARIDGATVVVDHEAIASPWAVRYAWANNPRCNLVNGAGLPASPFRTDDWPLSTQDAR